MDIKRAFDVCVATIALVVLSPVIAAVALAVLVCLGRPVLFTQWRPGLRGKPFRMVKFRSMSLECGPDGRPLPDAERLTRFGRLLRATSLDELPELWNVLVGEMSLVGPRPLLMEYLPLYTSEQARRHDVRPGITGWAQVQGRNRLSWDEKFALDLWYVENRCLLLDLLVIRLSLRALFTRDGISHAGEETMPKFTGTPS